MSDAGGCSSRRPLRVIAQPELIGPAIAVAVVSLTAVAVQSLRLRLPRAAHNGTATLVMAVTGEVSGLEGLVRALERQTLQPRRLILAIESAADPAFHAAQRLQRSRTRFPLEIVLAGPADHSAQKCRNLIAGCRRIDSRDETVVLLDADILPPTWWLSAAVSPLLQGRCDIVSGYRWPTLENPTLGAHLIAAIDRTIALLPRLRWARTAWGGTLAMSRRAFDVLALEHVLQRTLSDDLTIATVAEQRGLRVLQRSALLVPTPLTCDLASAWRFGRRQYQIIRIYRPQVYALALLTLTALQTAWVVLLARIQTSPMAQRALLLLILAGFAKQLLLDVAASRLGYTEAGSTRVVQAALILAKPLVDAFHLSMIVAAAWVRSVRWSHVIYRVDGPQNIRVKQRRPW